MVRLSTATRHKVVILHQQGLSQTKISKQTGVSRCAVQALLKKHKETGNVEGRRRSGRPRKLSAEKSGQKWSSWNSSGCSHSAFVLKTTKSKA